MENCAFVNWVETAAMGMFRDYIWKYTFDLLVKENLLQLRGKQLKSLGILFLECSGTLL